jgi:hypothetical protein
MRKILDIWTKTSTFPRSCLDRLEQRMNDGTPVAQSTTPPYSPGLPPLTEEDKLVKASSIHGQGKFLFLVFSSLSQCSAVVDCSCGRRKLAMPLWDLKQDCARIFKNFKTGLDNSLLILDLPPGRIYILRCLQSRPLACILYRRILPALYLGN